RRGGQRGAEERRLTKTFQRPIFQRFGLRAGAKGLMLPVLTRAARTPMKICIYGAGAIGGYLGVQLARAGADVSLVARGAHLAAMRQNGVTLLIGDDKRVERLRCTDDASEL